MSDLLRSTYHPPGSPGWHGPNLAEFTAALKDGMLPFNPQDVQIFVDYNIDFDSYRLVITAPKWAFEYVWEVPRTELLDQNMLLLARWHGESAARFFRERRLIEPESNIELGAN